MKHIIRLGVPTHLKITCYRDDGTETISYTACGLIGTPSHGAAYDPRDVDCLNCQHTHAYKKALNGA